MRWARDQALQDAKSQSLLPSAPTLDRLSFGFGFAKADNAVAVFPLAAFFENFHAFETFEDVALGAKCAGAFKAAMLTHKN